MGLMDKVKAQAEVGLAKASEAGKAGQAKLEEAQAKRRADGLLHDLGGFVYAEAAGRGTPATASEQTRLIEELEKYEAEHGPLAP
jgi:hypothetical protein